MLQIGCHLSAAKGLVSMADEIKKIGADTAQFFSRNPRGGSIRPFDKEDVKEFRERMKEQKIGQILIHAPYTMNPCSKDEKLRNFAKEAMKEDLERLEYMPGNLYNFHPGSHVNQGVEIGISYIAEMLNEILVKGQTTCVLLETMAGKGSEVGKTFEELKEILDRVTLSEQMGVCLDTCHIWDGGYDIVTDLDGVLTQFDRIIGLARLKAVHLNDSMNPLGSHKDRHAKIGEGYIGTEALAKVINHPALRELPFYLETPNDLEGYKREIDLMRSLYQNE